MSEAKSLKRPMDLSGEWRLKKVEGDLDQFFKDMGYSYLIRKAAALVMLALRKTEIITMDAFKFQCFEKGGSVSNPLHRQEFELKMGGNMISWIDPTGAVVDLRARWEDGTKQTLVFETGNEIFPKYVKKYMKGEHMISTVRNLFPSNLNFDQKLTCMFESSLHCVFQ